MKSRQTMRGWVCPTLRHWVPGLLALGAMATLADTPAKAEDWQEIVVTAEKPE